MFFRIFPLFFAILALPLFATEHSWYSKIDTDIEVSLFLPSIGGTISNVEGTSDFKSDFGYGDSYATYLALNIKANDNLIPNLSISYFNMQDDTSADLNKTIKVADGTFSSSVATTIDYQILSAIVYQDLKGKGKMFSLFGKAFYSGDVEFDIGIDTKYLKWNYEVEDLSDTTKPSSWIHITEFIPSPYLGVRYYLYNFVLRGDVSALAFSRAEVASYKIAAEYRVVGGLYLNGGYMYERFNVTEKNDKIEFKTAGYKFGFRYAF